MTPPPTCPQACGIVGEEAQRLVQEWTGVVMVYVHISDPD